jgi:predicted dehydrogenase
MNGYHRRHFLTSTMGAAATASQWVGSPVRAAKKPRERIKVGQIGIGHNHASAKMATFRKLKDQYEVLGVVEPDLEWRKRRGDNPAYRGLTWMTEQQLLNTEGLALVAVETDVCDLVQTAARCIGAGMHLHLDKPGGESLGAFHDVLDAAERQGLTVQMGYMYRNNPAVQFCLNAVRQGWLGEIFEVHSVMSRLDGAPYRQWLSQFRGGAMYIFGCHLIDLIVAMLGKPDKITPFPRQTLPEPAGLNDNGLAVLEYPRATATVRTSVIEVEGYKRRQLVVCGTEGTIDIHPLEPPQLRLALSRPRDSFQAGYQNVALPAMPGRYDDQLIELANIIRGEVANPYPPAHERMVQEALLAASGYPLE